MEHRAKPVAPRCPTARARATRAALAVLVALTAVVLDGVRGGGAASAHDALRSANPAAGATLDRLPREVVLTFTEAPLGVGAVVRVTSPSGAVVSTGPARVDRDTVRQAIAASDGGGGAYRVDWRVTSHDGHPVSDTFGFSVDPARPGPTDSPTGTATGAVPPSVPATPDQAGSHGHSSGGGAAGGDHSAFIHTAGTILILLLGAFAVAWLSRRPGDPRERSA